MTQETFPMIVGGEETLNERTLLTQVESGLMMNGADSVRFIVIHCSATQSDRDYTVWKLYSSFLKNRQKEFPHESG